MKVGYWPTPPGEHWRATGSLLSTAPLPGSDMAGDNKMKASIAIALTALLLTSCSVYMAADKKGTDMETLAACQTKTCLVANGAEPLDVKGLPPDTEAYKVLKPTGSAGRAVMHGLLDIATLGLWEAAGTPIEGHYDKTKYYAIRVTYEPGTEKVKQIALAQ